MPNGQHIELNDGVWGIITLVLLAIGFVLTRHRQNRPQRVSTPRKRFSPYSTQYLERLERPVERQTPQTGAPSLVGALPITAATQALVGIQTWLRSVTSNYHTLVAGGTGAGKSTVAKALLSEYTRLGARLVLIDPHAAADDYGGLEVIGAGRDYRRINAVLKTLLTEMDARYKERATVKGATFERVLIYVDEVPAIAEHCPAWSEFLKRISAEARKVEMTLLILTQSVNTEDLGVNAQMRNNFAVVALGRPMVVRATELMKLSYQERNALLEALKAERYPATTVIEGSLQPIDTTAVPQLAQRPIPSASVWSVEAVPSEASEGVQTGGFTQTDNRRQRYLELIVAGASRETARTELRTLDNNLWAECRRELGL